MIGSGAAGLGEPGRSSLTSPAPERTFTLDCRAIDTVSPPSSYTVIGESVALQIHGQIDPAQNPTEPEWPLFGKTGLGVRADRSAQLVVPPESRPHLRLGWGPPATPSVVVRTSTCLEVATPTGWLWHAGGYWANAPGCYPIDVHTGHEITRVRIPVGATCH